MMKKGFKYYAIIWAVLLVVYNVIVFSVQALPGYEINYDARFWVSWSFILVSFIGQLACAYIAFKAENSDKLFLNIPLISESYSATVLMTIVASICMLIPDFPAWIATIICVVIFAVSAVAVVMAKAAGEAVSEVGEKVKAQTAFIRTLTADAEILLRKAKDDECKSVVKKVYEAIRYSDPMSNEALEGIEAQIEISFGKLTAAVDAGDTEGVKKEAEEIMVLIESRNKKCKGMK